MQNYNQNQYSKFFYILVCVCVSGGMETCTDINRQGNFYDEECVCREEGLHARMSEEQCIKASVVMNIRVDRVLAESLCVEKEVLFLLILTRCPSFCVPLIHCFFCGRLPYSSPLFNHSQLFKIVIFLHSRPCFQLNSVRIHSSHLIYFQTQSRPGTL